MYWPLVDPVRPDREPGGRERIGVGVCGAYTPNGVAMRRDGLDGDVALWHQLVSSVYLTHVMGLTWW